MKVSSQHRSKRAPVTTLVVGRDDDRGHEDLSCWLSERAAEGVISIEGIAAHRLRDRLGGSVPDVVVVLQSWPEEFAAADVEQLLTSWPLARVVCCYGLWCESDGRTRTIWPLPLRVPSSDAVDRLRYELDVLRGERLPLPVTASREEAFAADYLENLRDYLPGDGETSVLSEVQLLVLTPDREFGRMLAEVCRAAGAADVQITASAALPSLQSAERTRIILWDADPLPSEFGRATAHDLAERIQSFRADVDSTIIVAITGYSRGEYRDALLSAGVQAVHSRLAGIGRLIELIESLALPAHLVE